jgi:CubicO group peptidase (beta-lactamase class C family)
MTPMSSKRVVAGILLSMPVAAGARQATPSFPSDADVRAMLERHVAEKRAVGVIVGLVMPAGERRVFAAGTAGPGRLPLDADTVTEIASVTKSFTGTLLASMLLDGSVALDEPVQQLLPPTVRVPLHDGHAITLRHLTTHTSALARDPPPDPARPPPRGAVHPDYTVEELYAFVSGFRLPRAPGARWQYSNAATSLLGHALARRLGAPYEQLVTNRILTPLGMGHTAVVMTPWMEEHLALAHDAGGQLLTSDPESPAYIPAGGFKSTTNDLLAYVAANIDAHLGTRTDAVGKAMALAHRVHYEEARANAPPIRMGLNWFLRPSGSDTIVWQGGGRSGYATLIAFVPSRRMGVVVLTNSARGDAYDLGFHLLDPTLPPLSSERPSAPESRWNMIVALLAVAIAALGGAALVVRRRRRRVMTNALER